LNLTILIILAIMAFMLFPPYFHSSTLAFHTASTANMTLGIEESTSETAVSQQESSGAGKKNGSLPINIAMQIYNHTNKALQALGEGNTSEVENQLILAKGKLSLIMSNNISGQQSQESNTTQPVASPGGLSDTDIPGDTAINSPEDSTAVESTTNPPGETATVEADAQNDNRGISESEIRERPEERRQVVP
jgi:hypothetical protein